MSKSRSTILVTLLFSISVFQHFSVSGAWVVGSLRDPTNGVVNPVPVFVPKGAPWALGTNTVLEVPRPARVTNGVFFIWLEGGFYHVEMGAFGRGFNILAPPNDTNVWQLNVLAALATNLPTFLWTNTWGQISGRVLAGGNVSLATNNAGQANESLTVSASGGGSGQTNWPLSAVTNAGTAGYSNAAAFYPSNNPAGFAPSNALGSAAYSSALGYVPVNRAGDTMTGGLTNVARIVPSAGTFSLQTVDGVSYLSLPAGGGLTLGQGVTAAGALFTADVSAAGHDVGAATFTGGGAGLTSLNASQLSSGTVGAARLPDLSGTYEAHVGTLTNQYYASNAVGGGQFPLGTVSTGLTATAGPFLTTNGAARSYSFNGGGLTNLNAGELRSGTVASARLALVAGDIPTLTVGKLSDAGTAAYSNSGVFASAQQGQIITNQNTTTFTNFGAMVETNTLVVGTNSIHSTNQFQVSVPLIKNALAVDTNGNVFFRSNMLSVVSDGINIGTSPSSFDNCKIVVSGGLVAFSRADQSGGGGFAAAGSDGSRNGMFIGSGGKLYWGSGSSANQSVDMFVSRSAAGTFLVDTNLIAKGVITATNGFIQTSNSYPIVTIGGWSKLGNCGSLSWVSNNVEYKLWTNSIAGTAGTNLVLVYQ